MDKQYYPVEIEEKWVKIWAERKVSNKESDDSFSQVIPPPNVTGTLHMGHSFQYAIMDFYTRYHHICLLYTSPSPRDATLSRMPSSA